MSRIDSSSLWYDSRPAMEKDSKLYSIKPSDGTGDITIKRGCGFPATYVNKEGYIQKETHNRITYSDNYSNSAWTSSSTASLNDLGDRVVVDASSSLSYFGQTIAEDGERRYYIEAKKGTARYIAFAINVTAGGSVWANFDLESGTHTSSSSLNIYGENVESMGDGWYRCSFVFAEPTNSFKVYPILVDGVLSGAQGTVEMRKAAITVGSGVYGHRTAELLESEDRYDTARHDWLLGESCPSLLVEAEGINLLTDSNSFKNFWNLGSTKITNVADLSPENQTNASRLFPTSGVSEHSIYSDGFSLTSGDDYSFAIYIKGGNGHDKVRLAKLDSTLSIVDSADYDLSSKTVSNESNTTGRFSLQTAGYERIVMSGNASTTDSFRFALYLLDSSGNDTFDGNADNYISIYEATAEKRLEPSSVIPRSGNTGNRTAESLSMSNTSAYSSNGYMFLDVMFNRPRSSSSFTTLSISTGAGSTDNRVLFYADSDMNANVLVKTTSNVLVNDSNTVSKLRLGQWNKVLIKYHEGDFFYAINGVVVKADSSTTKIEGATEFFTGSNNPASDSFYFEGRIKTISFGREEDVTPAKAAEYTAIEGSNVAFIGPSSLFYGGLEQGDLSGESNLDNKDVWTNLVSYDNFDVYNWGINATEFPDQIDLILDSEGNPVDQTAFNNLRDIKNTTYKNLTTPKAIGFYDMKPDVVVTSGGSITRLQLAASYTGTILTESEAEAVVKDNLRRLIDYNIANNIITIIQKSFTIGKYYTGGAVGNPADVIVSADSIRQFQDDIYAEYSGDTNDLLAMIDIKDLLNDSDTNISTAFGANTNEGYTGVQYLQTDQQHWNASGYAKIAEATEAVLASLKPDALKSSVVYYP